jgi:hypothetical protein
MKKLAIHFKSARPVSPAIVHLPAAVRIIHPDKLKHPLIPDDSALAFLSAIFQGSDDALSAGKNNEEAAGRVCAKASRPARSARPGGNETKSRRPRPARRWIWGW